MNIVQKGGVIVPKIIDNPKETILNYARKVVTNEGCDSLTIRKVSKGTGIAVGTIYNYFSTKEELILQLMEDYWHDYLKAIEVIDRSHSDLFSKLLNIFNELNVFIDTFLEVWVKNSSSEYTEESLRRKKNFTEKLNRKIEDILIDAESKGEITLHAEPYTIAKFIMLNFFTMGHMKDFEYEDFEKIIKRLFE